MYHILQNHKCINEGSSKYWQVLKMFFLFNVIVKASVLRDLCINFVYNVYISPMTLQQYIIIEYQQYRQ